MKHKILVPTDLSEIKLWQYQKYLKLLNEGKVDEQLLALKTLEIFCGVEVRKGYEMKASDVFKIYQTLAIMFEQRPDLVLHFKIGETEFGFHPNLDEMTMGEYVDLDTYIGDWDNIHKAMAVLYRPILFKKGSKYNIENYEAENAEFMQNMPMSAVLSSIVFFYHLGIDLSKIMLNYLESNKNKDKISQQLDNLEKSGVGFSRFLHSLEEILQTSRISLN